MASKTKKTFFIPFVRSLFTMLRIPFWLLWVLVSAASVGIVISVWGSGIGFPIDVGRDVGLYIQTGVDWATDNFSSVFRSIKTGVDFFLGGIMNGLMWFPWPALVIVLSMLAWRIVNWKMAAFTTLALLFLGFMGLWDSAIETITLVIVTVTLSMAIGIPIGVLLARNDRIRGIIKPVMDGMQTMPSFVYLVPAIAFFSLGNVPAVMATIIYSIPPVIRLTDLGIRQVSKETIEAARSFGTTPRQILLKVQVPLALPTIMAGVNQTTLLALSMVVIAALVGAGGLGLDVWRALGRLESGNAFIAGLGIVFMAIIIDRLTQAYTKKRQQALEIKI